MLPGEAEAALGLQRFWSSLPLGGTEQGPLGAVRVQNGYQPGSDPSVVSSQKGQKTQSLASGVIYGHKFS